MTREEFNPSDPKYKKVEDFPANANYYGYVNVPEEEGGGFVTKSAYNPILEAKIETIIKNDPHALEKKLEQLHEEALKTNDEEKNKILAEVRQDGYRLADLEETSSKFLADKEVILAAVKNRGRALKYASPELQNDKEIVLAAIKENGYAIEFASPELKNDKEVILAAIRLRQNAEAFSFASYELSADKDFILEEVIKQNVGAFLFIYPALHRDKDFVLTAIKKNAQVLEFAYGFKWEKNFILEVIKQYPQTLQYAGHNNDLELLLEVAKVNSKALAYAPVDIRKKLGI